MRQKLKPCWAVYKKGNIVDCYFAQAVAMNEVDAVLGTGLFSPKWSMPNGVLTKGDFQIVPCETDYARVFIADASRLHSKDNPTIFPSLDALVSYLEERGLKIQKKQVFKRNYRLITDKGILEGKVKQVL